MSHPDLPKFEALLETLVQAIDRGQDWKDLQPHVRNALGCFATTPDVHLWMDFQRGGRNLFFTPTNGTDHAEGKAVPEDELPPDCLQALSRMVVIRSSQLPVSAPANSQDESPTAVTVLYIPRKVSLPAVADGARADSAASCRFVLVVEYKEAVDDLTNRSGTLKLAIPPPPQTLPEFQNVVEAAALAIADCLTGFILRWLLARSKPELEAASVIGPPEEHYRTYAAASLAHQLPLSESLQSWCDNVTLLGVSWLRDGRVTVVEVSRDLEPGDSGSWTSASERALRLLSVNGVKISRQDSRTARSIRYWLTQIHNREVYSQWSSTGDLRQSDFVISTTDIDSFSTAVRCEKIAGLSDQRTFVLVLECFRNSSPPTESELKRVLEVIRGTIAVVAQRDTLKARQRSNRRWIMMGCLLATGVWMSLPADFDLEVEGQVFPEQRRRIFAPENAIVDKLFVEENDNVTLGENLIQLRSPELDLEFSRLEGELTAAETRIRTLRALRAVSTQSETSASVRGGADLSTEEQQASAQLKSLQAQMRLIETRRAALMITAPIAGTAHRRRSALDLTARPVNRGQVLLEIGDTSDNAEWIAVLSIPDSFTGYLVAGFEQAKVKSTEQSSYSLPVELSIVGDHRIQYEATLTESASVTDFDGGTLSREGVAKVKHQSGDLLRPGMRVRARIKCGRRSRGFVWFREFVEFLQRKSFAWF